MPTIAKDQLPLLPRGFWGKWTKVTETLIKQIKSPYPHSVACSNEGCREKRERGQQIYQLKNGERELVAVFCSLTCQRQAAKVAMAKEAKTEE